jgi:hypothetical protein
MNSTDWATEFEDLALVSKIMVYNNFRRLEINRAVNYAILPIVY